jgi:hypothetical protein
MLYGQYLFSAVPIRQLADTGLILLLRRSLKLKTSLLPVA